MRRYDTYINKETEFDAACIEMCLCESGELVYYADVVDEFEKKDKTIDRLKAEIRSLKISTDRLRYENRELIIDIDNEDRHGG